MHDRIAPAPPLKINGLYLCKDELLQVRLLHLFPTRFFSTYLCETRFDKFHSITSHGHIRSGRRAAIGQGNSGKSVLPPNNTTGTADQINILEEYKFIEKQTQEFFNTILLCKMHIIGHQILLCFTFNRRQASWQEIFIKDIRNDMAGVKSGNAPPHLRSAPAPAL